eukprot:COSAG02_NODE_568_length_20207_cov_50.273374_4_plen_62_part_00
MQNEKLKREMTRRDSTAEDEDGGGGGGQGMMMLWVLRVADGKWTGDGWDGDGEAHVDFRTK